MDTHFLHHVLLHLHIFKNAGTTFDRALSKLFQDQMTSYDTENPGARISIEHLTQIQQAHPESRVITSHQVGLPVPVYSGVIFHPVFFLRNPIERIQSCYHFEKDVQKLMNDDVTMEMYVRRNLNNPKINACFGIQLATIADNRYIKNWNRDELTDIVVNSALNNMQTARCFGLVDRFDESFEFICHRLETYFPELTKNIKPAQQNISEASKNIDDKTKYVQDNLSKETYSKMLDALKGEIILYETAQKVFENRYNKYSKRT
ncbi:hypothetical protein FQV37_2842 [Psychrobacter nivimaris]|uniref:Sulfotransferase family protein n=1 Tax=Psychrobacter nivimaris TaxID=281738 RepID=A0A6N7C256_9GAMM|nr:sulfotransferase family 2 domain-containing protein [Psychrobacter nivimaris]KAF0569361.1 hypothetical protein FQV37_2842 [Psychrobacter nivimaris]|tara:strand:+ start:372 stop:1157 length:786 start_codon:yes stop_codon:yes gene_type:complete